MSKIKVLYVVSTLRRSGPTNQLYGIISNLDKDLFESKVLTLSPEPGDSRMQYFLSAGIDVESLNLSRAKYLISGKRELKKYIHKYEPDVIHTSGVRADMSVSGLNLSSRHCMTVRNFAYEDYVAKFGSLVGGIAARSNVRAMEKCKYVICCSKSLKELYSKILSHEIFVVQNGVDTKRFSPPVNLEAKLDLRDKLELPRERILFIAVGSLIKRKDPLTMIRAFKSANNQGNAVFVLLGDGELMEACKSEADENVILKGNVENVSEFIQASDYYVSASRSEGLPNSVLEAGRCGIHPILTDIPQHKEVFEESLELASWFKAGDVKQLTSIFEKKILNTSLSICNDLAEYIEKNFSNEIMSKKYQKIYDIIFRG